MVVSHHTYGGGGKWTQVITRTTGAPNNWASLWLWDWLFLYLAWISGDQLKLSESRVSTFIHLSNLLLCRYIEVYLSLHKLKDAWTASIFWLKYTSLCKCYIFIEGVLWKCLSPSEKKKAQEIAELHSKHNSGLISYKHRASNTSEK